MAVLLAHLLKWKSQPECRGANWEIAIRTQRIDIDYVSDEAPSLGSKIEEPKWLKMVWARGVAQATSETGLTAWPDECPWAIGDEVLKDGWLPD